MDAEDSGDSNIREIQHRRLVLLVRAEKLRLHEQAYVFRRNPDVAGTYNECADRLQTILVETSNGDGT